MTDPLLTRVRAAIGELYDIEAEVGRGAVGVVYAARDLRLRRRVAVKVLPPDLGFRDDVRTRFLREAETAAQLGHPHIVPIYDVGERDGVVYFVMALIEGGSLGHCLVRDPRPPLAVVQRILVHVADALEHAHAHGVVHRDIKPDNILLDGSSGRALVTDFGIARAAEGDQRITATGSAVGSPAYMSPEQALGDPGLDGRSDIYSLGVVAYQMLAGAPPFRAASTPAMLMKHVSEIPRALRDIRGDLPAGLVSAVELAMEKRPEHRWPSASAFRDAILRADDPAAAAASRRPPAPVRAPRTATGPGALPAVSPALRRPPSAPAAAAPPRPPRAATPAAAMTTASVWDDAAPGEPNVARPAPAVSLETPVGDIASRMLSGAGDAIARVAEEMSPPGRGERTVSVLRTEVPTPTKRVLSWAVVVVILYTMMNMGPLIGVFIFVTMVVAMLVGLARLGRFVIRTLFGLDRADHSGPATSLDDAFATAAAARTAYRVPGGLRSAGEVPPARAASGTPTAQQSILYGEYVQVVRNAMEEKKAIVGAVSTLSAEDKALLPPVVPTATALTERVCSIAQALHRMDSTLAPGALAAVEARLVAVRAEPEGAERDRRLAMLERQRESTAGLSRRREEMVSQMEGAMIALMNLKLDMLRLNAEGIGAVLGDVTTATQEARVLSREIGRIVEAAGEVRKL